MRSLLGRVILVVGFSLSSLSVCPASPFWLAGFLLKDQLLTLWGFPSMYFVAYLCSVCSLTSFLLYWSIIALPCCVSLFSNFLNEHMEYNYNCFNVLNLTMCVFSVSIWLIFLFIMGPVFFFACLVFFFFLILFIIYLFMAVLGLRFCVRAFPSCGKWGPLFIAVHGPLTIAASPVAEHRLQTRRLSNCGSRA